MAVPTGAAFSQSLNAPAPRAPHAITLRVDNDAFDFWMLPWNRPDEEYTSGVHIDYDGGDAPVWARRFLSDRSACTAAAGRCRTTRLELGQDIYTPAVSVDSGRAAPGARASAGWLFVSDAARAMDETRADELTVTAGVTGPPSLARYMQSLAHRAGPAFNRPVDWSRQLAFEPGVIARFEERRRLLLGNSETLNMDVLPDVAVSAGNVLTNAEFGFDVRLGWHLPHPWLPRKSKAFALTVSAGAKGQAIARNLFLDGSTFSGRDGVGHETFVRSGTAGVELRLGDVSLAYRAQSDSRSYALGPTWHPWSSLMGSVRFDR